MSQSRQDEILKYLAINGPKGFGAIRGAVNQVMQDHHSKKIYELDMSQLCHFRGLVKYERKNNRLVFSLTRLGELITYAAKSPVLRHKSKSSCQQSVTA